MMIFIKKIHKYIFSLAVIAGLISFSGYGHQTAFKTNNTEWVFVEDISKSKTASFYVRTNNNQEFSFEIFYNFNFDCFLRRYQNISNLAFKVATQLHQQFKYLKSFLELKLITSSFYKNDSESNFIG